MIWVTRARVTWPTAANSACVLTAPSRTRASNRIASAINRATRGTRPGDTGCCASPEDATARSRPGTTNLAVVVIGTEPVARLACLEAEVIRWVSPLD